MPWSLPNLGAIANWGANRGQDLENWWDKLGMTEPQTAGFFNRFPKPGGGSDIAALQDWFRETPINNSPSPPRPSPYISEEEVKQMMEERNRQYPDDPLRNRGWQQAQLPQGTYYKKPTPDYSDWGW